LKRSRALVVVKGRCLVGKAGYWERFNKLVEQNVTHHNVQIWLQGEKPHSFYSNARG